MAFRVMARAACIVSTLLFLSIYMASALSAQTAESQSGDANALFVSAVLKYREAEGATGTDAAETFREVRQLLDLLLLEHPESRPAQALRTEPTPGGVDLGKLPTVDTVGEPEGWNEGKRGIAKDLLKSYRADLKRIESVAAAADFATLASAAYAETYTDAALTSAAERGWTMVWRFERASPENPMVGAATAALFRSDRGTHALSFRGSKTAGDWVTNLNGTPSVSSLSNAQVDAAREIAQEVVAAHPETIFVGHSLGGRLAQVARLATGNAAVVFNTAPLGANDRLRALLDRSEPSTSLISFRSPEDPLTSLFSPTDIEVSNVPLVEGGGLVDILNADYTHSMTVLADAMQRVRLAEREGWVDAFLAELRARDALEASAPTGAEDPEPTSRDGSTDIDASFEILAGDWRPGEYDGWTFRIDKFVGKVTSGGDGKRPIGSEILRLHGMQPNNEIKASWLYRDGAWRVITARLSNDTILMTDGRNNWSWSRVTEDEKKIAEAAGQIGGFQVPSGAWGDQPHVRETLSRLIRDLPATDRLADCKWARGPIAAEDARALFPEGTQLDLTRSVRGFSIIVSSRTIQDDRVCLTSPIRCGSLYLCESGEALFVSQRDLIHSVSPPQKIEAVSQRLEAGIFSGNAPNLPVKDRECSISGSYKGATQVTWSGDCVNGRAEGEGTINWFAGENLVWRTRVGPQWGMALEEGRLRFNLDLADFDFKLADCIADRGSRSVRVTTPEGISTAFFENPWITDELTNRIAYFAHAACPVEGKRYEGITFSIATGNGEIPVSGRSYNDKNLVWREYSNRPLYALQQELIAKERDRKAAEIRMNIERQAEGLKKTYEMNRNITETTARLFIKNGKGTPEMIMSALEIDEVATLQRLEEGVSIGLEPGESMQSSQVDGRQKYNVPYSVVSPFERLERQLKTDLANIRYTSQLDLIFDMSANPIPRRMRLTCTFSSLSDVPRERSIVRASLISYSSGRDGYSVALNCRK